METLEQAVWQTAEKNTAEGLIAMLDEYILDPTFESYGNFAHPIKAFTYSHKIRAEKQKLEDAGYWRFHGNFYTVSWAFDIQTNDKATIDLLCKAIANSKTVGDYKRAKREQYNCLRFDIIYYLTETETKEFSRWNNQWWITNETDVRIPVDYTQEEFDNALAKVNEIIAERADGCKLEDKGRPDWKFEAHRFNKEEWADIVRDFHRQIDPLSLTRWNQSKFIIDKPEGGEWIEYTFQSTGRKILFKEGTYMNTYYDLKPLFRD